MIHLIIGTKAQFIKMMPLMHLLETGQRPYHLLDLGQHGAITRRIVEDFGLTPQVTRLSETAENVESYGHAARWLAGGVSRLCWSRRHLLDACFRGQGGISLIHGDTASTLLGMHLGRRAGLKVGLVEAGLSSGNAFDPFPEELIRRHAERRADLLFPPDDKGAARLQALRLRGQITQTSYNTGRDALMLVIQRHGLERPPADVGQYSVMTLHRLETLSRGALLKRIIGYAQTLTERIGPLRFYLHGPTHAALVRNGLLETLEKHPAFTVAPLLPYPQFVHQLLYCRYLLTDGGSIQEEASYLDKPCLILRRRTERDNGLGRNARLASYAANDDAEFLRGCETRSEKFKVDFSFQASRQILDVVEAADRN
jgi:UDP-N-acetylglucosamine 2-epimerase